jgi:hypothetical protein
MQLVQTKTALKVDPYSVAPSYFTGYHQLCGNLVIIDRRKIILYTFCVGITKVESVLIVFASWNGVHFQLKFRFIVSYLFRRVSTRAYYPTVGRRNEF